MDVLLDNARDQLDFPTFVSHLEAGLSVRTCRPTLVCRAQRVAGLPVMLWCD
jgi:hypothetical protein